MTNAPSDAAPRRPHPLDLLALVLAAAAAVIAYSFLFRREAAPLPVDPLLGRVLVVEFPADRDWKRGFAAPGDRVLLDDHLLVEVREASLVEGNPPRRRVRLRIGGRDEQQPYTLTSFRWGVHRGSEVTLRNDGDAGDAISVVTGEVLEVLPGEKP